MKFKTKYQIGDIIEYTDVNFETRLARINGVEIKFSWETLQRNKYTVYTFRNCETYCSEIEEHKITKKLNKKAFEKAYAEQCAKELKK